MIAYLWYVNNSKIRMPWIVLYGLYSLLGIIYKLYIYMWTANCKVYIGTYRLLQNIIFTVAAVYIVLLILYGLPTDNIYFVYVDIIYYVS